MKSQITHIIGIDEAGRGPLAGPVAVGLAVIPINFDWKILPHVTDSKKLSPKKRWVVYQSANKLKKQKLLDYKVVLVPHTYIDRYGISRAVEKGILQCFSVVDMESDCVFIKLDGLLKAPEKFIHQETIVQGDAKEKIIGLASIMAKVKRDMYMEQAAKKFPQYAFELHKGYGTKKHKEAISQFGLSVVHRKSYCH